MSNADDIVDRFRYRAPTPDRKNEHEEARDLFMHFAFDLEPLIPEGREKALVLTKLEEALFWANAAIARKH